MPRGIENSTEIYARDVEPCLGLFKQERFRPRPLLAGTGDGYCSGRCPASPNPTPLLDGQDMVEYSHGTGESAWAISSQEKNDGIPRHGPTGFFRRCSRTYSQIILLSIVVHTVLIPVRYPTAMPEINPWPHHTLLHFYLGMPPGMNRMNNCLGRTGECGLQWPGCGPDNRRSHIYYADNPQDAA